MRVAGFTFVRNAITYDYPVVEAIESVLPICDEFIVAVGDSKDDTLQLIKSINSSKIKIVETVWDDSLREGGQVLAVETDKAFNSVGKDFDWAFYIQADEVVHEKYLETIYAGMKRWKDTKSVDGLLFNYLHFYGSYDYVGNSSKWYDKEIRVIKNNKKIYSFRDAQGFKIGDNKRLRVKPIDAFVYHYGWVKSPSAMQNKQENFNKYWHDDKWMDANIVKAEEFDYSGINSLQSFVESHPEVMQKRIVEKNWKFEHDMSKNSTSLKEKTKKFIKTYFKLDLGYKNYRVV